MIGRDSGGVTLQWKSVKGQRYTIVYKDGRVGGGTWLPLEGARELEGTGELMTVRDTSPGAFQREYMSQTLVPVNPGDPRLRGR